MSCPYCEQGAPIKQGALHEFHHPRSGFTYKRCKDAPPKATYNPLDQNTAAQLTEKRTRGGRQSQMTQSGPRKK